MTGHDALLAYVLRLGDNALVTGQRMIERVTAEAELEEELANANFALDYIGQARMYYSYAGQLQGAGNDEDFFAYRRDSREFRNFLLLEQPNGDFGASIVRQFLFETFYLLQLDALQSCADQRLAEIAVRLAKELRYHLRHARQWLVRLGDGTAESHRRVSLALDTYWRYCGEFWAADEVDAAMQRDFGGPALAVLEPLWRASVSDVLAQATLQVPADAAPVSGGREGLHSEHFGYLIAELQHLHRSFPGVSW